MNQNQIKMVLENVNLIKEVYNVSGKIALDMYKDMVKANYDDYLGLKEKDGLDLVSNNVVEGKVQEILDSAFETGKDFMCGTLHEGESVLNKADSEKLVSVATGEHVLENDSLKNITINVNCATDLNNKEYVDKLARDIIEKIKQRGGKI